MDVVKQIKRVVSVNWYKSALVNGYYFGVKGLFRFPILLGYNVHIDNLGDRDAITMPLSFGTLCFGLKYDPFHMGYKNSYWNIEPGARVFFEGSSRFSKGTILNVFNGGKLNIGDLFTSNANFLLSCARSVTIGRDVLLGWNITIMDSDGGHIISNLETKAMVNDSKAITIGNHVWISAEASILKGSKISEGSIVGFKSNVCGLKTSQQNAIIAGNPASVVKTGIEWEH